MIKDLTTEHPLMAVKEVAPAIGITHDALYRMVAEGRSPLPVVKIGGRIRFRRTDLNRLLFGEAA